MQHGSQPISDLLHWHPHPLAITSIAPMRQNMVSTLENQGKHTHKHLCKRMRCYCTFLGPLSGPWWKHTNPSRIWPWPLISMMSASSLKRPAAQGTNSKALDLQLGKRDRSKHILWCFKPDIPRPRYTKQIRNLWSSGVLKPLHLLSLGSTVSLACRPIFEVCICNQWRL